MNNWIRWYCVGIVSAISLAAVAQPHNTIASAYDRFLPQWQKAVQKASISGVSWAIFTADTILYADGLGYANKALKIDATPTTPYRIGSITKLFTATLALQHTRNSNWSLNTTWDSLLPDTEIKSLYPNDPPITLRHLLSHQSGLPSDILKGAFTSYPNEPDRLLEQLPKTYLILPPGKMTVYSNIAYTAIGLALERATETPYAELLQQNITDPLNLPHTTLYADRILTKAYNEKGKAAAEPFIRDIPAGGLFSTVLDLATFAQSWMSGTLLPTTLVEEAWQPQNNSLPLDLELKQGLGWQIRPWGTAGKVVWHNGANRYYRSMLALSPDLQTGMVILSNDIRSEPLLSMAFQFLDLVGQERGMRPKQSRNQWVPDELQTIDLPTSLLASYTGTYIMPGYRFKVTLQNNKLKARMPGTTFTLMPVDSHLFYPVSRSWLFFTQAEKSTMLSFQEVAGVPLMLRHRLRGSTDLFGYRQPEVAPISTAWQNRIGRYEVVNQGTGELVPFTHWRIYRDKETLLLSVKDERSKRTYEFLLNTVDDALAIMLPVGRSSGEVIEVIRDNDDGQLLRIFGYILRKK